MTDTPTETAAPEPEAPPERGPRAVKTAGAWKQANTHPDVTLPSGAVVTIKLPNILKMVSAGEIPNPLIPVAIKSTEGQEVTEQVIRDSWDFTKFLVPLMMVEPTIVESDVEDLPIEDVTMLVGLANRSNDLDAIGQHIGGLDTVQRFREFRGILGVDEILERAQAGGS